LGDRVDPSVADAEGASEASHGPSLAQALVDPELFHALGLDVYGAVLDPRPEARVPSGCPAGELIGTCMLCGGGVGDQDWIFGAWGRTSWRFSGHTLPGAVQLATLRPLLCSYCAVRLKHKLIPAPDPDDQLEARQ
jgi:hypothetical protein